MTSILERLSASLQDRYIIERELGQGGMATVYLALDVRHGRHVAIKVLHPELSAVLGADRFLSEIRLTAGLQHPNILPLFDSGVADGLVYYVMPFVEGETLRGKLDRERQLSVPDTVRLASEIADALQYAHERGVIHRDIKPENVLLQNGHAIVADFGIALAVKEAGGSRMTQTGMSLGTPQYMAPEQAMGERNVDARADVYALGAVTYELLAGEPPFTGPNAQAIVAKLLTERSRPLRTIRDTVPANVEQAVATALEKLPADRMPTARAFSEALRSPASFDAGLTRSAASSPAPASASSRRRLAALTSAGFVAGIALAVILGSLYWPRTASAVADVPVRFEVTPSDSVGLRLVCCGQLFAISPDGRWLVYQGTPKTQSLGDSGRVDHQLYARDLTDLTTRALPGTRNAQALFFSPANDEIAFASGKQLLRVRLAGGDPQTIASLPDGYNGGGSWTDTGITFGMSGAMLHVAAIGGPVDTMFTADSIDYQFASPQVVDDPGVLLYGKGRIGEQPHIVWRSLKSKKTRTLMQGATPTYIASQRALLLVRADGVLVRYPFDIASGDTTGPATRVASGVIMRSPILSYAEYSASNTGSVVLAARLPGSGEAGMQLVDLHGTRPTNRPILPAYAALFPPHFSPDGRTLALMITQKSGAVVPLIYDLTRDAATLLHSTGVMGTLAFTARGDSVVYAVSNRDIYSAAIDGSGEPQRVLSLRDWSLASSEMTVWGPWIAASGTQKSSRALSDILVAHRDSGGRATAYAANAAAVEGFPAISPDGKWMAYASDETGGVNVYVSSFPKPGGRYRVTPDGGDISQWSSDSRTLYFAKGYSIYAESFTPGAEGAAPVIGVPKLLYGRDPWGFVGISFDGKSLAFIDRVREGQPRALEVRLHAVTGATSEKR